MENDGYKVVGAWGECCSWVSIQEPPIENTEPLVEITVLEKEAQWGESNSKNDGERCGKVGERMKEKVVIVLEDEYLLPFMDISSDGGWASKVYIGNIQTIGPHLPCHHGPSL